MSKVVVINSKTHEVENIIVADETDAPHDNTYFVIPDPDEKVDFGMVYDPETETFDWSPAQKDILNTKYAIEYNILLEDAWGD